MGHKSQFSGTSVVECRRRRDGRGGMSAPAGRLGTVEAMPAGQRSPRPVHALPAMCRKNPTDARPLPLPQDVPGIDELLNRLKDGVVEAYQDHIAPDSRKTYQEGWSDFLAFAEALEARGVDAPVLPREPGDLAYLYTLAMWLVWCCTERPVLYAHKDGSVHQRQSGLAWSTVSTRLAGVTKALAERGIPNPTDNLRVARVVAGLRRVHAAKATKVTALVVPMLRSVIDATYEEPPLALRDRALVALVHAKLRASCLARLDWESLVVTEDAWVFRGRGTPLVLRPGDDEDLCPVTALARWRSEGLGGARNGPVFPALDRLGAVVVSKDGSVRRSSKQALVGRVRLLAGGVGVELPASLSLPDLSSRAVARLAMGACAATPAIVRRDRSVLTMGLAAASRRRNLSEFDVADAAMTTEGLLLEFRRTKTEPRAVDVREVGGRYCPVESTRDWLACYEALAGRPLLGSDPLYPRIDRHGNLKLDADGAPARLGRAAFSEIVRRRAEQAGLVGRFRSHSLRRGFATTLARKNRTSAARRQIEGLTAR